MIPVTATRWAWLALLGLMLARFGWQLQASNPDRAILVSLLVLPLLLPLWPVWRLRHRALVVGGMILLPYFCIAVAEVWLAPLVNWPAWLEIGLIAVYFGALMSSRRSSPVGTLNSNSSPDSNSDRYT
ncbi:MAG: DUF2069 domain-containing protein [Wenzhouxiangellaceae bacterium]|nr:DUF2069 domain-containing protein [Wenzhouxiangellaceae bacterium]